MTNEINQNELTNKEVIKQLKQLKNELWHGWTGDIYLHEEEAEPGHSYWDVIDYVLERIDIRNE